jgi:hypothetical protein
LIINVHVLLTMILQSVHAFFGFQVTTLETSLHESQKEAAVSAAVLNLTQEFSAIRKR